MLKTSDFNFNLPSQLIANYPTAKRDASRLLVASANGNIQDKNFTDIISFLKEGDCLVINNSKVMAARLFATNSNSKNFEILLHKQISGSKWQAFAKPTKKMVIGEIYNISAQLHFTYLNKLESGEVEIEFNQSGNALLEQIELNGKMPLPPYIKREQELEDKSRYQTVYAKHSGSVAAPTAGLHFTPQLLQQIKEQGVQVAEITLHVGAGTFQPVKVDDISDHKMHSESYNVSQEAADKINQAKRVFTVGTTSTRVLESLGKEHGKVIAGSGDTDIFISPPYNFRIIDGMITNFHLPKSTLFMLVSSFLGLKNMQNAYNHAIKNEYRFYSYGDACLLIK